MHNDSTVLLKTGGTALLENEQIPTVIECGRYDLV